MRRRIGRERRLRRWGRLRARSRSSRSWCCWWWSPSCGSSGGRSRPISSRSEFERRGVQATYSLDRVGLRIAEGQQPRHRRPQASRSHRALRRDPDAAQAERQLRGLSHRRARRPPARAAGRRQGQLGPDRQIAPAAQRPSRSSCPISSLDIADASIVARRRRSGRSGSRSKATGNLTGGFKGRAAIVSPRIVPGRCVAEQFARQCRVGGRLPAGRNVDGPVSLDQLQLPGKPVHRRGRRGSMPKPASTRASPASTDRAGWRSRRSSPAPTGSPISPAT